MRLVVAATFLSLAANIASPQTLEERSRLVSGEDFVRAFLGHCGQNVGNNQRVVDAANALGYAPLPEEMKPLFAPQDPTAEIQGFIVLEGDGSPYMLGVSEGQANGQIFQICAVANPYISMTEVVSALEDFADLGAPDQDETQMGQRFRI